MAANGHRRFNAYCGNDTAADAAIEQLIRDYSADSRAAEGVGQTAWAYRKLQRHDRARVLYQYVVDNWPDNERAIFSQRGVVLTSIALDDQQKADSATEKLLTNFSHDKRLPKAIFDIVGAYRGRGNHEKRRRLAQYIVDNYPGSGEAIWAQQRIIFACIALRDDPNTDAGIDALFSKFSSHKDIASAVYGTARKLNRKDDETARGLYQYIVERHASDRHAILAQVNLGQIKLRSGDEPAAQAIFNKVLTDCADHPVLPQAVGLMAEGYWDQAPIYENAGLVAEARNCYHKALAKWTLIIEQLPKNPYLTAWAHHFAGECHWYLGEYQEAIDYYQKLVDNWPEYEAASSALFAVGLGYQRLKQAKVMTESEADAATRAAYERLLQDYATSERAYAARSWLKYHVKHAKGEQK